MTMGYPDFVVADRLPKHALERDRCGAVVRTWKGFLQPFGNALDTEQVEQVLADLAADRVVHVLPGGTLQHAPGCELPHHLAEDLRPGRPLDDRYLVEIAYSIPPAHPTVRALEPEITKEVFPDPADQPPHLLQPLQALCILFPPNREWNWDEHTVREYMDFMTIWLAKHSVWLETRERLGPGRGQWIGSSIPHDPRDILELLRPNDLCRCGSARRYTSCCRQEDERRATTQTGAPASQLK